MASWNKIKDGIHENRIDRKNKGYKDEKKRERYRELFEELKEVL